MSDTTFTFQVEETLKERFAEAAKIRNRTSEELLRELMHEFLNEEQDDAEYDEWFRREVQAGIDDANAGNLIPNEEVEAEFAARKLALRRKLSASGS